MIEEIKLVVADIERNIKPFTDGLIEKGLGDSAKNILRLIRAIESDPGSNCISLYNLLQFYLVDAVEKYGQEAADSLNGLYGLVGGVYDAMLRQMAE
jgi:hypothetical protein